jgi:hypothetical protein
MDIVIEFLTTLSAMSPLAVIALLGTIIFMMVKGKTAADSKVETIASNHLHELPEAVEILRKIDNTLQRIEVKMSEDFSYLKGRINGKHN